MQKAKLSRLKQLAILIAQCKAGVKAYFNHELCEAFHAANIQFLKLNNPTLNAFLEKYTSHRVTDENTLRKNYEPDC